MMGRPCLKRAAGNVYLLYTLFFLIVGAAGYFWILISGKTMLRNNDAFYQWYPFLVYIRRTVKELLLHGKFEFWAWDIGVGNDMIANIGSMFFDPFNYVAAAFPIDKIDLGYSVSEFLRLYVAGLLMIRFLRYRGHSRSASLIGAVSYTFCSWGLRAAAQASFLTQMVVFPLMILGIEKFEREKKSLLLILSVAFSLLTSLYFSYMSAILLVLYLIVRYAVDNGLRELLRLDFLKFIGKYALRVSVSVFLAGIGLVPALLGLMQAGKGESPELRLLPDLNTAMSYLVGYISDYEIFGNYSAVCLGAFFFAMIPAMFICIRKKECRLPVIMFFMCAVFLFFPVFNSAFNGFKYAVARWCYALMFFYTWAGIVSYESFDRSDSRSVRRYFTGSLILYGLAVVNITLTGVVVKLLQTGAFYISAINLIFAAVFGILLIIPRSALGRRPNRAVTAALVACNLALGIFIYYSPNVTSQLASHHAYGLCFRQYQKSLLLDFDPSADSDFYRVDYKEGVTERPAQDTAEIYSTFSNESMYTGIPSVFSYTSMMDPLIFEFDESVGIHNIFRTTNSRNDGRSRLNLLFGTRYLVARDQRNIDHPAYGFGVLGVSDDTAILRNTYDAGLGYVFPYVISRSDYETYSLNDREQIMMQAAVVPDDYEGSVSFINPEDLTLDTARISYEISETEGLEIDGNVITVSQTGATMTLTFDSVTDSELYISIRDINRRAETVSDLRAASLNEDSTAYEKLMFELSHAGFESNDSYRIDVRCNGIHVAFINKTGKSSQSIPCSDYLGNMGYYGSSPSRMVIQFNTPGTYDVGSIDLYAVSQANFDSQASYLTDNRFVAEEHAGDIVRGHVDSNGGILFMSIINNGGWSAYVDGEKADIINGVDIAFMGIELDPGYHQIELRYECPGFRTGVLMSVLGVIAASGITVYEIRRKRSSSSSRKEDKR